MATMKIIEIRRKVSGFNYDNLELVATVPEGAGPTDVEGMAIELDKMARNMLKKMEKERRAEQEAEREKERMLEKLEILKRQIEEGEINELPF